jgi:hypothetical protein
MRLLPRSKVVIARKCGVTGFMRHDGTGTDSIPHLPEVTSKLKSLQLAPFAKRAAQLEKFKPIITYWCESRPEQPALNYRH